MAKVAITKVRPINTGFQEEMQMLELPGSSRRPSQGSQASLASLHFNDQAEEVQDVGACSNMEVNVEMQYIRKNIKKRVCVKFTEKVKDKAVLPPVRAPNSAPRNSEATAEDPECYCGFKRSEHMKNVLRKDTMEKWSVKTHTQAYPTDAFGDIEFTGFGDRVGKYVRVDVETDMKKMLDLLLNVWGLHRPNLLISVTGGAKNFQMKGKLKEVFRRGLMKAALSTGAWIITGGNNAGVMKHVGEAVRDYGLTSDSSQRVITIGIAPWGCVQEKKTLQNPQCTGKWPAYYKTSDVSVKKESFLDCNHTHFILVDNGTQHQYAVEIPFRSKLEKAISEMKTDTGADAVSVPVVLLVLEGGPGSLETVYSALINKTPAVLIKGSGRAADILAFAYQNSKEEVIPAKDQDGKTQEKVRTIIEPAVEAQVQEMIIKEFGNSSVDTRVGWVRGCLESRDLITVFELDSRYSTRDVDMAILKALLKANKDQVMDQLRLALAWNRIDVAKSEIFNDERQWKTGELDEVMLSAIQLNRVDFVDLFLDNGVSLKNFLTRGKLESLYLDNPVKLLRKLFETTHGQNKNVENALELVGELMKDLLGDYYIPHYLMDRKNYIPNDVTEQLARPAQDLFIWAVLSNRQKMAKLFWREGKEQMAGALVANGMMKAMKSHIEDAEVRRELLQNAQEWEQLAIGVLCSCYVANEKKAQDLLIYQSSDWGDTSCALIAVQGDNKHFISQTACKALVQSIWMGHLEQNNHFFHLLFAVVFPPLIWMIIRFRKDEEATRDPALQAMALQQSQKSTGPTAVERQPALLVRESTRMNLFDRDSKVAPSKEELPECEAGPKKSKCRKFTDKFIHFYSAPVIVFFLNVIFYFIFLGLFSYFLLVEFQQQFTAIEGVIIAWVVTILVEEIRQLIMSDAISVSSKLKSYVKDIWNILDVITILLFIIGMILRSIPNNSCMDAARVILSLNLITFFFRLLHIFAVSQKLGPKIVMIRQMVEDLAWFVVILLVFIVSYAIASEAILYPNTPLTSQLPYHLIRKAYWEIFGEFFLEDVEGSSDCTDDPALYSNYTVLRCPTSYGAYIVPIMMGIYILLTNVLLLNLLIAMFSSIIQKVQDNTDLVWCFQHFELVIEFNSRPVLPPPLIIFNIIFRMFRFCCVKCSCCEEDTEYPFRKSFKDQPIEKKQLVQWENVIADNYLNTVELKEMETVDHRVKTTTERLDIVLAKVDEIHDITPAGGSDTPVSPRELMLPPQLEKRLTSLEQQMVLSMEALRWIMDSLQDSKQGTSRRPPPQLPDYKKIQEERRREQREQERRDREQVLQRLQSQMHQHRMSRLSPYPGSTILRFSVPDEKVAWSVAFPEYSPVTYTSQVVLDKPIWADIDLLALDVKDRKGKIAFNKHDEECGISRVSHICIYQVGEDGLPLNPVGRTGMVGRGLLGRWGPNHAGDPVVTRWKYDEKGNVVYNNKKPVLEFVTIQRADNNLWALPGGLCDPNVKVWDSLKTDFKEEALGSLVEDSKERRTIMSKLEQLSQHGIEIYKGYADDPRNTDNAWIETRVVLYHDDDGSILRHFKLRAGEAVESATWQTASSSITLHGSHGYFLKLVAERLKADF